MKAPKETQRSCPATRFSYENLRHRAYWTAICREYHKFATFGT
jgi:hypothetical protein